MKFLIDECLTPALAKLAREHGFGESTHVTWMGLAGRKDWELRNAIIAGDWTFVTCNSVDFRGSARNPGQRGQYADVPLHAGLICLNAPSGLNFEIQASLFRRALAELADASDLVNQVIDVTLENQEVRILRYQLPG